MGLDYGCDKGAALPSSSHMVEAVPMIYTKPPRQQSKTSSVVWLNGIREFEAAVCLCPKRCLPNWRWNAHLELWAYTTSTCPVRKGSLSHKAKQPSMEVCSHAWVILWSMSPVVQVSQLMDKRSVSRNGRSLGQDVYLTRLGRKPGTPPKGSAGPEQEPPPSAFFRGT